MTIKLPKIKASPIHRGWQSEPLVLAAPEQALKDSLVTTLLLLGSTPISSRDADGKKIFWHVVRLSSKNELDLLCRWSIALRTCGGTRPGRCTMCHVGEIAHNIREGVTDD